MGASAPNSRIHDTPTESREYGLPDENSSANDGDELEEEEGADGSVVI